jgi:hypothetical protein
MLQILDSLFEGILHFGGKYGPPVALAVVAFIGCGIVLEIFRRVLKK